MKKLTVESVVEKIIWNEIVTGSSGTKDNTKSANELLKIFLRQIRGELYENKIEMNVPINKISKIFAEYLNEK